MLGHVDGVAVIDDSAATTPRKVLGSVAGLDRSRLIVLVGGNLDDPAAQERAAFPRLTGLAGLVRS